MINRVTLIGNLGRDPETRHTGDGTAVCSFSIATSETYTKDGEKETKTDWHNIVTFGKLAEICQQYLHKGKLVYIEGKLRTDTYEKDGETRYSTKVIANTMKMLGGKGEVQAPTSDVEDEQIPF